MMSAIILILSAFITYCVNNTCSLSPTLALLVSVCIPVVSAIIPYAMSAVLSRAVCIYSYGVRLCAGHRTGHHSTRQQHPAQGKPGPRDARYYCGMRTGVLNAILYTGLVVAPMCNTLFPLPRVSMLFDRSGACPSVAGKANPCRSMTSRSTLHTGGGRFRKAALWFYFTRNIHSECMGDDPDEIHLSDLSPLIISQ